MRNTLASLVLLLAGCATAPAVQVPQPLYADGVSFTTPCPEHGSHVQTIASHSLGVVYTVRADTGDEFQVPEFALKEVLDQLGVTPSEESGQQTPANQVPPSTGPEQSPTSGGPGTTGGR